MMKEQEPVKYKTSKVNYATSKVKIELLLLSFAKV